jgi:hypothetical protein
LVLGIKIFSGFSGSHSSCYSIETLWDHSLATACLAREIARHLNLTHQIEDSFLAGLLKPGVREPVRVLVPSKMVKTLSPNTQ